MDRDPRLEAEGEVSMGRLALHQGELEHAARHVANALSIDPGLPDALLAPQELAGRAPDRASCSRSKRPGCSPAR